MQDHPHIRRNDRLPDGIAPRHYLGPPTAHHRPERPPLRNVDHNEDFPLSLTLRDSHGHPMRVPDYDFTVILRAGAVEYLAGRFDGRLLNCRPSRHDDCTLVILCSDHGFPPCPELQVEITYHVPDSEYSDRFRDIVRRQPTGICLTVHGADLPGYADFDSMPAERCGCRSISRNELDDLFIRLSHRTSHRGPHPGHHHPHPDHAHPDPGPHDGHHHADGCIGHPMRPDGPPPDLHGTPHESISGFEIDCIWDKTRPRR